MSNACKASAIDGIGKFAGCGRGAPQKFQTFASDRIKIMTVRLEEP